MARSGIILLFKVVHNRRHEGPVLNGYDHYRVFLSHNENFPEYFTENHQVSLRYIIFLPDKGLQYLVKQAGIYRHTENTHPMCYFSDAGIRLLFPYLTGISGNRENGG